MSWFLTRFYQKGGEPAPKKVEERKEDERPAEPPKVEKSAPKPKREPRKPKAVESEK